MDRLGFEDINNRLARKEKISLGGGGRVIWAPEFPQYADKPGFWDHACYLDDKIERLFTITLVEDSGRSIPFSLHSRHWVPGKLTLDYQAWDGISVQEEKIYHLDTLVSRLTITSERDMPAHLSVIVWSTQRRNHIDSGQQAVTIQKAEDQLQFTLSLPTMFSDSSHPVGVAIGADRTPRSVDIHAFEGRFDVPVFGVPVWETTPFYECFSPSTGLCGLPGNQGLDAILDPSTQHWLTMALEYPLDIPPHATIRFNSGAALAPTALRAGSALRTAFAGDVVIAADKDWAGYWSQLPSFQCSDPKLERAYWYRWFGLRLNTVNAGAEYHLPYRAVYEGINAGWFRHAISYSTQALMRDLRWMKNPDLAQDVFRNFVHGQRPNGAFPGAILPHPADRSDHFYHSNWGTSIRRLHHVHPDRAFLEEIYLPLMKYAEYFLRERDAQDWHLFDVCNQWETGQEYMARYVAVAPAADQGSQIRLKGIDATSYCYELFSALSWLAGILSDPDNATRWQNHAAATRQAVRQTLWDGQLNFFTDLDPRTSQRIPVLSAVGFYPFTSDLAGHEHLPALYDHLLNPNEFWTPYPIPTAALNEPLSSPWGIWKGERKNCPWNGRSWLMTNSHACEALARAALVLDSTLRKPAAELIKNCLYETFLDGDLNRPSSYEYYNPINGKAPYFRGTDDYMHSYIIDLIIQYVAGLQPQDGNLIIIDPLPFDLDWYSLQDVWIKGHRLDISWHKDEGLSIYVDRVLKEKRPTLSRIEITL